jgi:flavin reductase (DIM6/NTAB) family NADH-FMN oxidoreductase RutF
MREAGYFAVNFLAEDQEGLSRLFASQSPDRFLNTSFRDGAHGCPLIEGCLGFLECKQVAAHEHGDHTVLIGEVLAAQVTGGNPLLYYRSAYARLGGDGRSAK